MEIAQISKPDIALWQRVFKKDETQRAYRLFFGDLRPANGNAKYAATLLIEHLVAAVGPDAETVERMMRQTRLDQAEWDTMPGRWTWLQGRIQNAIDRMGGKNDRGQNYKTGGRARRVFSVARRGGQAGGAGLQGGAQAAGS